MALGDSIAVNGVCLTVTDFSGGYFTVDVMPVTLQKTNLGTLSPGKKVNLERALKLNVRIGGHLVSGHVDCTGAITQLTRQDNALRFLIEVSEDIRKFIITAGSITLDGVSLTVAELTPTGLVVSIIPHTAANTTLTDKCVGETVNIEADVIGKYLYHFLQMKGVTAPGNLQSGYRTGNGSGDGGTGIGLSKEFLAANGFLS